MKKLNLKKVLGLTIVGTLLIGTITLGMTTYKNYTLETQYNEEFTDLQQLEEIYKLIYSVEENDKHVIELEYYFNNYDIQVLTLYAEYNNSTIKYLAQLETIDGEPIELEIITNKEGIIKDFIIIE